MNAMAFHITMRPTSDTWIAESTAARRRLARLFYACGNARGLMAFRAADTHVHALVAGPREVAGEFARAVQISMRQTLRLPHPFEPARIRPVETFKHLRSTVAYLLRQAEHHGLGAFDREHEASSLLDLLGMRCIDSQPTSLRLFAALPRLSRADLLGFLGVPLTVPPDANHYLLAAPAVVALPSLARFVAARSARNALLSLLRGKLPITVIAERLEINKRTLHRDHEPPQPALVRAIELHASLRASLERPSELEQPSELERPSEGR